MRRINFVLVVFFVLSMVPTSIAGVTGDVNGDGKVGLEEAINALSVTAGLRTVPSDTTYDIADYKFLSNHDYVYVEEKFEADTVSESVFTASVTDQTINDQNLRVVTYDGGFFAGMQEYAVFDGEKLTIVGWHISSIHRTYWFTPGYIRGKSGMRIGDVLSNSYVSDWGSGKSLSYREELILGTEDVTVPAGSFSNCLKIRTYRNNDDIYVSYLAKNVGLVKQIRVSSANPNLISFIWELISVSTVEGATGK